MLRRPAAPAQEATPSRRPAARPSCGAVATEGAELPIVSASSCPAHRRHLRCLDAALPMGRRDRFRGRRFRRGSLVQRCPPGSSPSASPRRSIRSWPTWARGWSSSVPGARHCGSTIRAASLRTSRSMASVSRRACPSSLRAPLSTSEEGSDPLRLQRAWRTSSATPAATLSPVWVDTLTGCSVKESLKPPTSTLAPAPTAAVASAAAPT
jgi:hypothetical protein